MKKVFTAALLIVAAGATACVSYSLNDKPDYIQSAEVRVGSYLTSYYGKVACNSAKVTEQRWELGCTSRAKGKTFQYAVYSADQAPYSVSRSFYLEAINDEARQSAKQGLMQYLQINTKAG
ncbi:MULTISPECIES: hypothetical protein [Enterobacter]|uniref:hypothetical protein n=1 Tax=Enterobacter TaxID=547 RepID=UPI001260823B|nr:hypothetical protein [Enterobacter oligotrophicus]ELW1647611.1 hypothetical protein [Enterobacter oligotrophicus]MBT9424007.1 hypothetical protein [Enterobacter oligotrophicus]